jgi:hypothetical protein
MCPNSTKEEEDSIALEGSMIDMFRCVGEESNNVQVVIFFLSDHIGFECFCLQDMFHASSQKNVFFPSWTS